MFIAVPLQNTITNGKATRDIDIISKKYIEYFHHGGRKYIRCNLCLKYPAILKINAKNNKPPAIASTAGTNFRHSVLLHHLESEYHRECVKVEKKGIFSVSTTELPPIESAISKQNEKHANYVGKLMTQVFIDAKQLTLTAFNWPARYVSNEMSNEFSFNVAKASTVPDVKLMYVNPIKHLELMSTIVSAYIPVLKEKIENCLAFSLRIDGSIDRTQKDKIYVMAKIIDHKGIPDLLFLGVAEQTQRKAIGLKEAALNAIKNNFSEQFLREVILKNVSSLCTDGTNANTGGKGGLWKLFQDEVDEAGSEIKLYNVWCVAHRADLAFNDMIDGTPEADMIFSVLKKVSSYFHASALRTSELEAISKDKKLNYLTIPKLFEVRWVEYSWHIIRAILTDWNALILYFNNQDNTDKQAKGFVKFFTDINKLHIITFLGDLTFVFQRFQKKLQADSLTLPILYKEVKTIKSILNGLKESPVLNGFESIFAASLEYEDNATFLKKIKLHAGGVTRSSQVAFEISKFRNEMVDLLLNFLIERFEVGDEKELLALDHFIKLDAITDIEKVHQLFGRDLDLASIHVQFLDLSTSLREHTMTPNEILKFMVEPDRREYFNELATLFARVLACTPHSADVERCISANNSLKTNKRYSVSVKTENKYLFVRFNLPCLEEWDVRPAVLKWISDKNRREVANTSQTTTTRNQKYFKHVFKEAKNSTKVTKKKDFPAFHF